MANKNTAMEKILNGRFEEGFSELAEAFETEGTDDNLIEDLCKCFFQPNITQMSENFIDNAKLLKEYPYIFTKDFAEPENNRYILFPLDEKLYYCYDKQRERLFPMEVNSEMETKYFFKDLDDPLLVENEFNEFNLKFLNDNVRDSNDFAGDNHIYLWFENADLFSLLMYYIDLRPLFVREKFVVLIGEERNKYPIDFKREFNIDYSELTPKEIELDDIKRFVFGWKMINEAGTSFLANIMDFHPNLLTIPDNRVTGFPEFYRENLIGKTVQNAIRDLKNMSDKNEKKLFLVKMIKNDCGEGELKNPEKLNRITSVRILDKMLDLLKGKSVPTAKEWLSSIYLAFSLCRGRTFSGSRIAPAIFDYPHSDVYYIGNSDRQRLDFNFSIAFDFPYYRSIVIMRDPLTYSANVIRFMTTTHPDALNDKGEIQLDPFYCFAFAAFFPKDFYFPKQHPMYAFAAAIRLEDLKLNSKAALTALGEFLDIPVTESLFHTTWCGVERVDVDTLFNLISGFDPSTIYEAHTDTLSVFDKYRIEMALAPLYKAFGYEPLYYDGQDFTYEQKVSLMELPFLCESIKTVVPAQQKRESRQAGMNFVKIMLSITQFPFTISSVKGDCYPIKWLKPKEELLVAPIYRKLDLSNAVMRDPEIRKT